MILKYWKIKGYVKCFEFFMILPTMEYATSLYYSHYI
jgi:hypothetical protein